MRDLIRNQLEIAEATNKIAKSKKLIAMALKEEEHK